MIFGASGMIGQGVLLECIESPYIEKIHLINRKPLKIKHPKVEETLLPHFRFAFALNKKWEADAVFYCAGIDLESVPLIGYRRATYDALVEVCESLIFENRHMKFFLISDMLSDSSEQVYSLGARLNGMAENAAMIYFQETYIFRVGFVEPVKGVESKQTFLNKYYRLVRPLFNWVNRIYPHEFTNTTKIGKAMIYLIGSDYYKRRLRSNNINELAESYDLLFQNPMHAIVQKED